MVKAAGGFPRLVANAEERGEVCGIGSATRETGGVGPAADNPTEVVLVGVARSIVVVALVVVVVVRVIGPAAAVGPRRTSIMRWRRRWSSQMRRRSSAGRRGNGGHVDGDTASSARPPTYTSLKSTDVGLVSMPARFASASVGSVASAASMAATKASTGSVMIDIDGWLRSGCGGSGSPEYEEKSKEDVDRTRAGIIYVSQSRHVHVHFIYSALWRAA